MKNFIKKLPNDFEGCAHCCDNLFYKQGNYKFSHVNKSWRVEPRPAPAFRNEATS